MTDYPEDILRAARAVASFVYWGEHDEEEHAQAIAAALAAERERCAKIADNSELANREPHTDYVRGRHDISGAIAAAIRGEKP